MPSEPCSPGCTCRKHTAIRRGNPASLLSLGGRYEYSESRPESAESMEERRVHAALAPDSIELGVDLPLPDFECVHGRLPGDRSQICECWPRESWLADELTEDLMEGVRRLTRQQVIGLYSVAMINDVLSEFEIEAIENTTVTEPLYPSTSVHVVVSNEFGTRSYILPATGGSLPVEDSR